MKRIGSYSRNKALLLIGALAVVAGTYWLSLNMTLEEVAYPASLKGEAVRNEMLAAQRLMTALGLDATTSFGLKRPPPGDPAQTVIVMPTYRRTFTPDERVGLLDWVDRGGKLVVVAHTIPSQGDAPDWLLSAVGVTQTWSRTAIIASSPTSVTGRRSRSARARCSSSASPG